jgi:hypothetical protein
MVGYSIANLRSCHHAAHHEQRSIFHRSDRRRQAVRASGHGCVCHRFPAGFNSSRASSLANSADCSLVATGWTARS